MATTGAREDMFICTVSVDGVGDLGVFDKFTGGEVESAEQKYSPGAMAPPVSLGGAVTMGNVVLERLYVLERDHDIIHKLMAAGGIAGITASKQPLDTNRVPYGRPLTYTGVLKQVAPPDHDSTSSNPATVAAARRRRSP